MKNKNKSLKVIIDNISKKKELGLEEVGRRALAIRDLNSKRIVIQNKIVEKFGGFKNIKKNHRSESWA